jgi:3-dehydroquinate dehydratase II
MTIHEKRERNAMKALVIHGAGLDMRGKVQLEVFGPMTLPQYEEHIRGYAKELGIEVSFFHSNIEGEVVNKLYQAFDSDIAGVVINPGGYTAVTGPLRAAIAQMKFPVIEVHLSNPTTRGTTSVMQPVCKASVYGFGIDSYRFALAGLKSLLKK